jgi:tripartite-type tricarboxylate transporter receptor subunit TctC
VPATSVNELIALAKAKPGALHYGSGGSGTPPHLCAEILKSRAGIDVVHVPYKGVTPALTDLLAGQVQFVFSVVPAGLPLIRANKLRALAVTSEKRTPLAPDVPTIAESLPGFEAFGWYGLMAPVGTPAEIVKRLNAEAIAALKTADLQERFIALGADPIGTTPQAFGQFVRSEMQKWRKAVKDSGARVE